MKVLLLYFILFFPFIYGINILTLQSETVQMILINKKIIYSNDETTEIIIKDITNIGSELKINDCMISKYKYLLELEKENFIIFGFTNENKFTYYIYNMTSTGYISTQTDSFNFLYQPLKYIVRMINENVYVLSYISDGKYYIYLLELNKSPNYKFIKSSNENDLNTFECDSYDGTYIFCVYSISIYDRTTRQYNVNSYYFFKNVSRNNEEIIEFQIGSSSALAISLLKIEYNSKKKFLICSANSENIIYCQYFLLKDNELFVEGKYQISKTEKTIQKNNYLNNNPIKLKRYNYSIYILLEMTPSGVENIPVLYVSPLDFSMNIPIYTDVTPIKNINDFMINDKYFIILKTSFDKSETLVDVYTFTRKCSNKEIYQFNSNLQNINIFQDIINENFPIPSYIFLSFSLDILTFLYINDKRFFGTLLSELTIEDIEKMNLYYNKNLEITENYYVYHGELTIDKNYNGLLSNFCYLKVINCYQSCSECHSNIVGTSESHQCLKCLDDNYNRYITNTNEDGYYNCYRRDDPFIGDGLYLGADGFYHKCDASCKSCSNNYSCNSCKEGYYFKAEKIIENKLTDICYSNTPEFYYFDTTSSIALNGEIYNFAYKKCFDNCKTCFGDGDITENKCITCKSGFISYPFDSSKCTIDKDNCLKDSSFWKLNSNNNIECTKTCEGYLIYEGLNKNQCVEDCQYYINPYETKQSKSLLIYSCESYKFCLSLNLCKSKKLNYDESYCYPPFTGCVNIAEYNPTQNSNSNSNSIDKRVKLIKTYEYDISFNDIKDFILNQTLKYYEDLNKELSAHPGEYLDGIDFITSTVYKDFIITIYPLLAEDYVYNNLFDKNKYNFINFTQFFKNMNYQLTNEDYAIIIALIQYKNVNVPINLINYFIFIYDEKGNKLSHQITTEELERYSSSSSLILEVSYSLNNFYNPNINNSKYTANLISTIKEVNLVDPNLNLYDKNDKFFNSICYTYKSDMNTDITIEDRINEYYIGISLCEKDCALIKVYDKEENKNPRSLCQCKMKKDLTKNDDNYSFNLENIEIKKVGNTKALSCAKDVFSSKKINANFIFWIYILIFLCFVILILNIIIYSKSTMDSMMSIQPPLYNINNINIAHQDIIKDFRKSDINGDFKINKFQSVKVEENLKNSFANKSGEKNKVFQTSPNQKNNSEAAPPKRIIKTIKKNEMKLVDEDTTNNANEIEYFEEIYDEDKGDEFFNNYLKTNKDFLKNNYLEYKRRVIFKKIKNALKPLTENDLKNLGIKYNRKYNYYNPYRNQKSNLFFNDNETCYKFKRNAYKNDDDTFNVKMRPYYKTEQNLYHKNDNSKDIKFSNFLFNEESGLVGDEKFFGMSNSNFNNNENIDIYPRNNDKKSNLSGGDSILVLKSKKNKKNDSKNIISENSNFSDKGDKKYFKNSKNLIKKESISSSRISLNEDKNFNKGNLASNNSSLRIMNKSLVSNDNNELNEQKNNDKIINNNFGLVNYDNKILISSLTEYENSNEDYKTFKSFIKNYWNYLIKREFFFATFYNKSKNIAIFIRISTFFFVISFIFTINCLFLTKSSIHKRYLYAKEHNGLKEFKYVFGHEFLKCFLVALISLIFKMICIKVIYGYLLFRIRRDIKLALSPVYNEEKGLNEKKEQFYKIYLNKSYIYIAIIFILIILFGYISVCYVGTFPNTKDGIILCFFISLILSFIFCCFICFVIVGIYQIGKIFDFQCFIACYDLLKLIY